MPNYIQGNLSKTNPEYTGLLYKPNLKEDLNVGNLCYFHLYMWLYVVMLFNATFNNISIILWWSVLLVEETGVTGKTINLSQITDKFYHIKLCL